MVADVTEIAAACELIEKPRTFGLEFYFRATSTGRVYHVAPGRHPREPRFWCIWIHRCNKNGMHDDGATSWLSDETMARDALADALAAARTDLMGWIKEVGGKPLLKWIQEPIPAAELAEAAAAKSTKSTRSTKA